MARPASKRSTDLPSPSISARLLQWYDRHARRLPWRARPGERADPYRVWLSEVMLQQTTVATVGPYFQAFLERWPTVEALAAAPLDDVLTAWAGLGYYARARNLHACARQVAAEHGGAFPDSESALRALPGIGAYTAAAVAAIAFERKATPLDGNIERVVARLFAVETPLPQAKPALKRLAEGLTPDERAGDYAQAMMDLGATVCLPRRPKCLLCPLNSDCAAHAGGSAEALPRRAPKAERPTRRAVAFWVLNGDGDLLLRRRPPKGLLGGMMELPSTDWREAPWPEAEALVQTPVAADWRPLAGQVRHTFTHFHFEIEVWAGRSEDGDLSRAGAEARWVRLDALGDEALPSVMHKIVKHALTQI
ncbi:MAG: A/G-specific adenine glycosylase [Kiloniellales bacterium]|nr:A/G-specific adenine glycosylase [Kiloniellales bacterium]